MKVTVSVKGRFHAFYLARELQRHGYLHRIITSYPVFETAKYGVERDKIKSLFVHEVDRVWRKAPRRIQGFFNPQWVVSEAFDLHASLHIPEATNLFVGWSSLLTSFLKPGKASWCQDHRGAWI